jgi:hypothetical protein
MNKSASTTNQTPLPRIYVHTCGEERVKVVTAATLKEILNTVDHDDAHALWIEGEDEAVDLTKHHSDHLIDGCHVFHGRCRSVIVVVRYNGQTISEKYAPTKRISEIIRWAIGDPRFGIGNPAAGDFTLKLSSIELFPEPEDFVGSFVGDDCEVCLDLRPADKFQG